jgi:RimJ/RimL family protein N-acetyltransferase
VTLRPPDPPLQDELVLLRPWRRQDVDAVVDACRDPETIRWTRVPVPYTPEDGRTWIDARAGAWAKGVASLAVVERSSGEVAAALTMWAAGDGAAEFGYWATPGHRGKGYTTRAVRLLARWAFDELELDRLQLGTMPGNTASERVAIKLGFQREGTLRSYFEQRGERRDVVMWSLLPGELQ